MNTLKKVFTSIAFLILGYVAVLGQNNPCSATSLPNNMMDFQSATTSGLSPTNGVPDPGCGLPTTQDAWFSVTAPPSGNVYIATLPGTMTDAAMAIYDGPCGLPSLITCTEDDLCGNYDMPIYNFDDLTPGTTYYIRIWGQFGQSGSFEIRITDGQPPQGSLTLVPASQPAPHSPAQLQPDGCYQFTTTSQSFTPSCAYEPNLVDFSQPFTNTVQMYFGTQDANGADGITMIYQNEGPNACGVAGGDIAGNIPNSFIIEFDTWDNGVVGGDIFQDHVAINVNGNMQNPVFPPVSLGNIEDGQNHEVTFTWNPATMFFEVFFDGTLYISGNYDIIANCFGGTTSVYCGYTSSTGGATNEHKVCPGGPPNFQSGNLTIQEVEICQGDSYFAGGSNQTMAGTYQDVYPTWNGCDSIIETRLSIIQGSANILNEIVCSGNCVTVGNQNYCNQGSYSITLPNWQNCDSTITLNLSVLTLMPNIIKSGDLDCNSTQVTLNAATSTPAGGFYSWSTSDGNIIGSSTGNLITINQAGTYTLTMSTNINGSQCTETTTIQVFEDDETPDIFIDPVSAIDCNNPTVDIDASSSDPGTFSWSGPGIVSGENSFMPTVNMPGDYTLTLTGNNGCPSTQVVTVNAGQSGLNIVIEPSTVITCANPTALLDGSNSDSGTNFQYAWTTSDGTFDGPTNMPTATASAAGTYTLTITDLDNNCTGSDMITITDNLTTPDINIANANQLTCDSTTVTLQGSSTTANISIAWTTVGGTIMSGTNSFSPVVSGAGDYTMTLTDPANGCPATQTISVTSNTTPPVADAGTIQTLDCSGNDVTLDGSSSSSGTTISYVWTDAGNVNAGNNAIAMVNMTGLYTISVTDSTNGCSATDTVSVIQSTDQPNISYVNPSAIDCQNGTVTIDASASDSGANYTITWTTVNGTIDSGANGLMPVVSAAGDYEVMIVNNTNSCSSSETITVMGDAAVPQIMINPADDLTCSDTLVNINATTNLLAGEYTISWATGDGNIVGTDTLLNINVNQIGTYTATIINTSNNCDASANITINSDLSEPTAEAGDGVMIGCAQPSVDLDGTGSSTTDVTYTWLDPNGGTAATGTLMPSVGTAGTYTLVVTNDGNGCSAQDTVSVMQDANLPTISVLPTSTITCAVTSVNIDASNSDNGPNYTYNWETTDGTITSVVDELTVDVSAGGTYTFTLTNTDNNCTAMQDVVVPDDLDPPNVIIAMPNELSCDSTTVTLDGSPSGNSADFVINWTTANGTIESNGNTFFPVVSTSAVYIMEITSNGNGCMNSLQTFVPEDLVQPNVEAGMNQEIGCDLSPLNLAGSSSTLNATYSWDTGNGNILADADTENPSVNQAGIYTLTVTDPSNGCTDTDDVEVTPTSDIPTVTIIQPANGLTCDTPMLNLDATGSDDGMGFTLAWTTANGGNITMGNNSLTPTIDEAGDYILTITNTLSGCDNNAMVTITEDAAPFALTLDNAPALDCQTTSATLNVTPDGMGNFDYQWATSDGSITQDATTATPTIDQGGTYMVTVTNTDNGCDADTMITVTQDNIDPIAIVDMGGNIDCLSPTASIDASNSTAGLTYTWTTTGIGNITNGNTLMPTVDNEGTYVLTVFNSANQCDATTQIVINADTDIPVIDTSMPDELSCQNTEEQLTITPSNGVNFTYAWTTANGNLVSPDTDQNPLANQSGDYEVTVTNTDNNCTETAMITLIGDFDLPMASIATAGQITCEFDNIDLTGIDNNGAGNYTYEWTSTNGNIVSGATALTANVNQGGTYIFNITNEDNGCEKDTMITIMEDIAQPTIDIETPGQITCIDDEVMLDASNSSTGTEYEYEWVSANTITNPTTATPTVMAAGNYVLTITNTDNGCESTENINVIEDTQAPNISLDNTAIINCETETIDLVATINGTTNNSFAWTTTDGDITSTSTGASATAGSVGSYTLTATNEDNGCEDDATITVVENLPTASIETTQPICADDRGSIIVTDVLGGEAPYIYSIDGGDSFSGAFTFSSLESASYDIVVQDINGCEFEESAVITTGLIPEIVIEEVQTINLGETVQLDPQINFLETSIDSLSWTPSDSLSCDTCLTPISNTLNEIAYTLYIEVEGGCTVEKTVIILVDRTQKIYAPNAFSPNNDGANDTFTLFAEKNNVAQIDMLEIFTRWGQKVFYNENFQPNDESQGWNGVYDKQLMNAAVFIWRAEVTMKDGRKELLQGDVVLMR